MSSDSSGSNAVCASPSDLPPLPEWLPEYARKVCAGMSLDGHKLKGRGHAARIELTWGQRLNPFTEHLPAVWQFRVRRLQPPGGKRTREEHAATASARSPVTGKVRHALEAHWQELEAALHACGFDLDRNAVVNPKALAVAAAWWGMHQQPLPAATAHQLEKQTLGLLAKLEADENRAIARVSFGRK